MAEIDTLNSLNIGVASPLLSRFDIVLILRDERNPDWDNRVADHILYNAAPTTTSDDVPLWSVTRLQTHFMAIRDNNPQLTPTASAILSAYYQACRANPMRDPSRTSVSFIFYICLILL